MKQDFRATLPAVSLLQALLQRILRTFDSDGLSGWGCNANVLRTVFIIRTEFAPKHSNESHIPYKNMEKQVTAFFLYRSVACIIIIIIIIIIIHLHFLHSKECTSAWTPPTRRNYFVVISDLCTLESVHNGWRITDVIRGMKIHQMYGVRTICR